MSESVRHSHHPLPRHRDEKANPTSDHDTVRGVPEGLPSVSLLTPYPGYSPSRLLARPSDSVTALGARGGSRGYWEPRPVIEEPEILPNHGESEPLLFPPPARIKGVLPSCTDDPQGLATGHAAPGQTNPTGMNLCSSRLAPRTNTNRGAHPAR